MLSRLCCVAAGAGDVEALSPAFSRLAGLTAGLPPCSLYEDWACEAPERVVPLLVDGSFRESMAAYAADGGLAKATASGAQDGTQPSAALSHAVQTFWSPPQGAASAWWQLALSAPTFLSHVQLDWVSSSAVDVAGTPEACVVQVSADGGRSWARVHAQLGGERASSIRVRLHRLVSHLRLHCGSTVALNASAEISGEDPRSRQEASAQWLGAEPFASRTRSPLAVPVSVDGCAAVNLNRVALFVPDSLPNNHPRERWQTCQTCAARA